MFIVWFCAVIGLSLLILVAHQISLGNIADGAQIASSISLLIYSLLAWTQTRGTDQSHSTDSGMTFQSILQDPIPQHPQTKESTSSSDALTLQIIATNEPLRTARHESGLTIIDPNDAIPEEVSCAICGKNILQTRNEFGGVMVCPYADCGYWYHKNHFDDTAGGKCISPLCRRRS